MMIRQVQCGDNIGSVMMRQVQCDDKTGAV